MREDHIHFEPRIEVEMNTLVGFGLWYRFIEGSDCGQHINMKKT